MTFLNIILLGGIAAISIPVIIHFFHRSQPRVVRWGAMHLLDSVLKSNARRLNLQQLLLLLIRVGIPLFLALCMARPVFTGMKSLLGNAKSSVVLLLDNSYSMEAGHAGQSNFSKAQEAAEKIVANLGQGSEVALSTLAGGTSSSSMEPMFDLARAPQEIKRMDAAFGSASVAASLEASATLLSGMHHANREIVLISDFQKINWSGTESLANAQAAQILQKLQSPPSITFIHVGEEVRDNVSVESLDFSRMVLGINQKIQVRANLRNYGSASYSDLKVYFRADGKERAVSEVSLGAHEQGQVLFTHAFETAGSHVIEVYADADDALKADNNFQASIPVWDKIPVLLVNGGTGNGALLGETDFLEIALRPFGAAKLDPTDLIATRVVNPRELNASVLSEQRVVVLANVPQLDSSQLKALEDFVRNGGGLLIFPGSKINTSWYQATLWNQSQGLLPAPMISLVGSLNESTPSTSILAQHYDHPSLELFNDPRNGSMADCQIRLWYRLKEEAVVEASRPTVLARFDTGDPFLVEKKFGEGRVIQCSIPCNAEWSNLPLRSFYLPLMQQLTTYLASTVFPPRNVSAGQSLVAFLPVSTANQTATLTDPIGQKHSLTILGNGARGVVEFKKAQRPGLYVLEAPNGTTLHFVVNAARSESDLQQLTEAELKSTAKNLGASLASNWKDYLQLDQKRRYGQEIWKPLLWIVLALCFAELFLQQFLAKAKSK